MLATVVDVRIALCLLADLTARYMIAIVSGTHLRKSNDGAVVLMVIESLGFVAVRA
jgi:hypothetical protein